MIRQVDRDSPDMKPSPSKPILIRKPETSLKRNRSANLKVTFSEHVAKKFDQPLKTQSATEDISPMASNMTIAEFERLVNSRLQSKRPKEEAPAYSIRPNSATRGTWEAQVATKRPIPLTSLFLRDADSGKNGRLFSLKGPGICSQLKEVSKDDRFHPSKALSFRLSSSNLRPFSQSFRENNDQPMNSCLGFVSPTMKPLTSMGFSRKNYSRSVLDVQKSIEELGISPDIEKKSMLLIIQTPL